MRNKEAAIAAVRTCRNREDLDDMLSQFDIIDPQEIIDFLNECMYNPQTFFSSKLISIEDELEFTKQMFLTGKWRLNEYYDRMGIKMMETNA